MAHVLCYLFALVLNVGWLLLGDHIHLTRQMAIPLITVAVAGLGVWLRTASMAPGEGRRYRQRAMWALLLYYLAILSVLLFFGGLFHIDRGWGGTVNLKPLHTIRSYLIYYERTGSWVSIANLLGNVVITIPLGMLLPMMFPRLRRFWLTLPLCALFAVGVEYIQWRTATGAADVDDSILNFAGAFLGYLAVRTVQILCRRR